MYYRAWHQYSCSSNYAHRTGHIYLMLCHVAQHLNYAIKYSLLWYGMCVSRISKAYLQKWYNMTVLTIKFFIKYSLNLPFFPALGASKNSCDSTYCGSAPESEKETKALADFIREHLPTIKAYLTIHSYSQLLLFPYSYTYKLPSNYEELVSLFVILI